MPEERREKLDQVAALHICSGMALALLAQKTAVILVEWAAIPVGGASPLNLHTSMIANFCILPSVLLEAFSPFRDAEKIIKIAFCF